MRHSRFCWKHFSLVSTLHPGPEYVTTTVCVVLFFTVKRINSKTIPRRNPNSNLNALTFFPLLCFPLLFNTIFTARQITHPRNPENNNLPCYETFLCCKNNRFRCKKCMYTVYTLICFIHKNDFQRNSVFMSIIRL